MKKSSVSVRLKKQQVIRGKKREKRKYNYSYRKNNRNTNTHNIFKRVELSIPENFSFIENPDECVNFLNIIESTSRKLKSGKIIIDATSTKYLTPEAITVLVSVIKRISRDSTVRFFGNYPNNPSMKEIWINSGFNELVKTKKNEAFKSEGKILRSYKQANMKIAKELIDFATMFVHEEIRDIKGVYAALCEMMANTEEHASSSEVKEVWWASTYCNKETGRASFTFVDCGEGIFKTVKYGINKINLKIIPKPEILRMLLKKEINLSQTKKPNRGNGLRCFQNYYNRKHLKRFIMITNNVYANLDKQEFIKLDTSFKGTFYYWEYDNECN